VSLLLSKFGFGFSSEGCIHLSNIKVASNKGLAFALPPCVCPEGFQNSGGFPLNAFCILVRRLDRSIPPNTSADLSNKRRTACLVFNRCLTLNGCPLAVNRVISHPDFSLPLSTGRTCIVFVLEAHPEIDSGKRCWYRGGGHTPQHHACLGLSVFLPNSLKQIVQSFHLSLFRLTWFFPRKKLHLRPLSLLLRRVTFDFLGKKSTFCDGCARIFGRMSTASFQM